MWHGSPDLYMKKREEILDNLDDSETGFFLEFDIRYRDDIKKTKNLPFCPETDVLPNHNCNDYMKKIKPTNYTEPKKK